MPRRSRRRRAKAPVVGAWTMTQGPDGLTVDLVTNCARHAGIVRNALNGGMRLRIGVTDGTTEGGRMR